MKGLSTAVLTLFLSAAQLASLAAVRPDGFRPPFNLQVNVAFQPVVERMWQGSPTFRRQCRRLAAEPGLQVKVLGEDQPARASFADARTAMTFQGNVLVTASVYLKHSANAAELLAHELEHILEQLDRVDLQAQAGNGAVWRSDRISFETRRAVEAGRRVTREIMDAAGSVEPRTTASGGTLATLMTLKQQDRDAAPLSPRAARVSADGRYVVFISSAGLVDQDRNQLRDVYVTDLASGRTTLESVGPDGLSGNGASTAADISGDGRYVVFESEAGNLTGTQFSTGTPRVFLRDRTDRTTRLLTTNAAGEPGNGPSWNPVISANAAAVAFESGATDLIAAAEEHKGVGVYLIWLGTGRRTRVDAPTAGRSGPMGSGMSPSISADGRYVVFGSKSDLTCQDPSRCTSEPSDRNGFADVYLRDTQSDVTTRISRSLSGGDPDGPSYDPAISGDGRFVAFVSDAANLTRNAGGRPSQIYIHELASGKTALVSHALSGRLANGPSGRPALSFDGSIVAFQSLATNLVCESKCQGALEDINLLWDVFVYDRRTGQTARMSGDGADEWMENSRGPALDAAGRVLAFGSRHPIDEGDGAYDEDLYVVSCPRPPLSTASVMGVPK